MAVWFGGWLAGGSEAPWSRGMVALDGTNVSRIRVPGGCFSLYYLKIRAPGSCFSTNVLRIQVPGGCYSCFFQGSVAWSLISLVVFEDQCPLSLFLLVFCLRIRPPGGLFSFSRIRVPGGRFSKNALSICGLGIAFPYAF